MKTNNIEKLQQITESCIKEIAKYSIFAEDKIYYTRPKRLKKDHFYEYQIIVTKHEKFQKLQLKKKKH